MNSTSEDLNTGIVDTELKTVFTFGQNSYGELCHGDPDTNERKLPARVDFCTGLDVVDISCGNEHTAILCGDGRVFACGYNDSGQCGIGNVGRVNGLREVAALSSKNVKALASGNGCEHLAAITESGELYTWGYNARGQCGHDTITPVMEPTKVAALAEQVVTHVASSYFHTVVSTEGDEVYAFGRNDFGQLGIPDGIDKHVPTPVPALRGREVLSISCGQYHTVLSLAFGGVYAFGKNDYGQLGVESPDVQTTPVQVSAPLVDEVVTQIACGYYHTLALTNEGKVYSFGRNDYGQLGLGHKHNMWRPGLVPYLSETQIAQVSCGCYHSVALSADGFTFPFGRNNHGQLGVNNTLDSSVPLVIEAFRSIRIQKISAGFYHTACLSGNPTMLSQSLASTLSSDFAKLINNSSQSDVTFVLEGRPIYAHRCMVMARCEPLERMLNGPMREGRETEVVIPNYSYEVFLAFIEYLYTDEVKKLQEETATVAFAFDLLGLSDQFLVEGLKRKCERAIQKQITVDNVAELYSYANVNGATALKRRCYDYIINHFGTVIGTTGFAQLDKDLLKEILTAASARGVTVKNAHTLEPNNNS